MKHFTVPLINNAKVIYTNLIHRQTAVHNVTCNHVWYNALSEWMCIKSFVNVSLQQTFIPFLNKNKSLKCVYSYMCFMPPFNTVGAYCCWLVGSSFHRQNSFWSRTKIHFIHYLWVEDPICLYVMMHEGQCYNSLECENLFWPYT